jgi:polyhydroxyalkanoate synthesis regulator phasin
MAEPMTDEQWAIVRQQIDKLTTYMMPAKEHAEIIGLLTDEVERLRQRVKDLEATLQDDNEWNRNEPRYW